MLTAVTITEVSPSLEKRKDQEPFYKAETLGFAHMLISDMCQCVWVCVCLRLITLDTFVPVQQLIHLQIWQVSQKISQVSYKTNTALITQVSR